MEIVNQIITARKQKGITQQKLSEMTGILQPVIARVESKRSSPTVEFLSKVLDALDLELCLKESPVLPKEIVKRVKHLTRERISVGRSKDKVYTFSDKYILKISKNKDDLRLEKEKTDWLNYYSLASKTIEYIEDEEYAFCLRTNLKGHTLIEPQFLNDPYRLLSILKKVVTVLRELDDASCPFVSSNGQGNDFVHGDLCLPNIIVDDNDEIVGFIDLSNMVKGDKDYDYSWLVWSFEYNLRTKEYTEKLLQELGINIDPQKYLLYVVNEI